MFAILSLTYIHNWSLQSFSQNYWSSFSHHLCCVCVNFIHKWQDLQFLKSIPNDRFFEKLFMAISFTLRVFVRNLLRENRRRNTFRISLWCLAWDSNPDFSSNRPTHYLLDHGDSITQMQIILLSRSALRFSTTSVKAVVLLYWVYCWKIIYGSAI